MNEVSRGRVEEILEPMFMSSEESDIEEGEHGQTRTVGFIIKPLPWERTMLKSLKKKLDAAYDQNLTDQQRSMRKPRIIGQNSTRDAPKGPSWAVRLE